jgi:copper chaperone
MRLPTPFIVEPDMIAFEVQDMTCGHCARAITQAVQAVDPQAQVRIDLTTHRVAIEAAQADASALGDAIREAGYTPVATTA